MPRLKTGRMPVPRGTDHAARGAGYEDGKRLQIRRGLGGQSSSGGAPIALTGKK